MLAKIEFEMLILASLSAHSTDIFVGRYVGSGHRVTCDRAAVGKQAFVR